MQSGNNSLPEPMLPNVYQWVNSFVLGTKPDPPTRVHRRTNMVEVHLGAVSIRKTVLPGMAIPMLKIRRPNGRLTFNMEITIRRWDGLYIETGPCSFPVICIGSLNYEVILSEVTILRKWTSSHPWQLLISFVNWCTVEPLYNTIVFHQNTHKRHPIARP